MTWYGVSKLIADVAPLVGAALAGPTGSIAGKLISIAIGCANDPKEVTTAIQNDSTLLDKIKALEENHINLLTVLANFKYPSRLEVTLSLDWKD